MSAQPVRPGQTPLINSPGSTKPVTPPSTGSAAVLMPDVFEMTNWDAADAVRAKLTQVAQAHGDDPGKYLQDHLYFEAAYQVNHPYPFGANDQNIWSQWPAPETEIKYRSYVAIVQWDQEYCKTYRSPNYQDNWCYTTPPTQRVMGGPHGP